MRKFVAGLEKDLPAVGESGAYGELEHRARGGIHNQTQTAEARRLRQRELRPLEGQSPGSLKTASDVRAVGDGSHHLMFGRAGVYVLVWRDGAGLSSGCRQETSKSSQTSLCQPRFTCKTALFRSGRCWVRTSDLLLVREALYP